MPSFTIENGDLNRFRPFLLDPLLLKAIFNINNSMYVCLCLGVSDRQIQKALDDGCCSAAEVMRCTGAGTRCGTCRSTVEKMVRGESVAPTSSPVRALPLLRIPSVA
jgi:bacterioferritin-associated ferredoxin